MFNKRQLPVMLSQCLQIWMLTGDKLETAICIAKSSHPCSMFTDLDVNW